MAQQIAYPLANMARKETFPVRVIATLERGTKERIEKALGKVETRAEFIRAAIESELERREAAAADRPAPKRKS
jgi:hypothetical protein